MLNSYVNNGQMLNLLWMNRYYPSQPFPLPFQVWYTISSYKSCKRNLQTQKDGWDITLYIHMCVYIDTHTRVCAYTYNFILTCALRITWNYTLYNYPFILPPVRVSKSTEVAASILDVFSRKMLFHPLHRHGERSTRLASKKQIQGTIQKK